jgi:hypothetical protein
MIESLREMNRQMAQTNFFNLQRIAALEAMLAVYNTNGFVDADALAARFITLEAELAKVKADAQKDGERIIQDLLDHQALLLDAEGKIERMKAERDAAVARLRYLYDDTMSKLIWHDKPPISFDQYAFNIDAARSGDSNG